MTTSHGFFALILGIFVLASGYSFSSLFLTLLGILILLSSIIDLPWLSYVADPKAIDVRREVDKKNIFAGDFLHIKVTVTNKSSHTIDNVEIYDGYPEIFKLVVGSNNIRTRLPSKKSITFSYIVQCPIRGKFKLGPLKVNIYNKRNFHFEERTIHKYDYLLVYPTYEDVRKMKTLSHKRQLGVLYGVHRTKHKGMGTEFFGIRTFVPSDELRFIDWKSYARTGKLHTREFEIEKNIRMIILMDISGSMGAGATGESKLEYGIRATLLLTNLALERRDLVGLLVYSDKIHAYLEPSVIKKQFYDTLEVLAPIEATGGSNLILAAKFLSQKVKRSSFVVLISDLEGSINNIREGIKILRANRHNIVVISPFGPWFEVPPYELSPTDKAITEAISYELLEKHRSIEKLLARLEVPVIEVGPDNMLPTVIEQYLRAKKLGIGIV